MKWDCIFFIDTTAAVYFFNLLIFFKIKVGLDEPSKLLSMVMFDETNEMQLEMKGFELGG